MNLSCEYKVDEEVTFQRLEDVTVLVHLATGRIHHSNVTGSRIWELLEEGRSAGEILEILETEFDSSPDCLRQEVEAFLQQLSAENMIHPVGKEA